METYYLSESGLRDFLGVLTQDFEVYGTIEQEDRLTFEGLDSENVKLVTLRTVRCYESPKALLFPTTEKIAEYSTSAGGQLPIEQPRRVIVGLRQCDVTAVQALDKVFLEGDYVDPFYKARRESTLLLSTDCADAAESCFCTLIGGKPYPTEGFDINFSPLADGYIAEVGSERGAKLLDQYRKFFGTPTEGQLKERENNREAIRRKVQEQNKEFEPERPIEEVFSGEIDEKTLQRLAWDCVECGACTNVCPACHCFLMFDRPAAEKGKFERLRSWDSCIFGEYQRMAGVAGMKPNPRPEIRTRFVNRFLHKYLYFYQLFKMFGCTGCGRCYDACLGGIDPRRVIQEMSKKKNE